MRVSMRFEITIAALIVALLMSALSLGTTGPVAAQGHKRYVLVGANNTLPANLESLVAASGGKVVHRIDEIGVAIVESDEPAFVDAAEGIRGVQGVAQDIEVEIAPAEVSTVTLEDGGVEAIGVESHDPTHAEFFARQWNLHAIGVNRTLTEGFRGDPRVRVAIVDTGIDYTNLELAGKIDMVNSRSFFSESLPLGVAAFADVNGHGTHVAGIIAAKGRRVAGVAPNITLIAVKVGGRQGFASWVSIAAALVHAASVGADVINTSFGAAHERNGREAAHLMTAMIRAVNFAHAKGALVVASAGNTSTNWDQMGNIMKLPAQLPHVVAASATGPEFFANLDNMADYSDYGQSIVNFAAPGGSCIYNVNCNPSSGISAVRQHDGVRSACSSFQYVVMSNGMRFFPCANKNTVERRWGTSMSAAHLSGVAALVDSTAGGAMRGEEIASILKQFADDLGKPGKDAFYGFGRVNAYRAVTRK